MAFCCARRPAPRGRAHIKNAPCKGRTRKNKIIDSLAKKARPKPAHICAHYVCKGNVVNHKKNIAQTQKYVNRIFSEFAEFRKHVRHTEHIDYYKIACHHAKVKAQQLYNGAKRLELKPFNKQFSYGVMPEKRHKHKHGFLVGRKDEGKD